MNRAFTLVPFSDPHYAGIVIRGTIERRSNSLSVRYRLSGLLSEIVVLALSKAPERRDRLWEETCMELFIAPKASSEYWEFNFSPAGHWNAYRFVSYRKGMKEEQAFGTLQVSVWKEPDELKVSAEIPLDSVIAADKFFEIGITAVVKHLHGDTTYWALVHPGPEPDFHRRESFILEL